MAGQHDTVVIKGGVVLTMDPQAGDPYVGDVVIRDGNIVAVGPDAGNGIKGAEVVDASGKIVMPGLIDNHWHMWQGLIPGVSADDTFGEYFARSLDGFGPKFTPEDCGVGVMLSALAGLEAGKTTVLDWNHGALTPDHVAAAIASLQKSGIRAIEAYGPPANTAGWYDSNGSPSADDVRGIYNQYIKNSDGRVGLGLAIRGPEFSNMERVTADVSLARELQIPVTIHAGIPGFFQQTNSVTLMGDAGLLDDRITFVHCNAMQLTDFQHIKAHGGHVSSSPEVEMQMGFGRSPLGEELAAGLAPTVSVDVPTAIGADLIVQARILLQRQREQYNTEAFVATGKPLAHLPLADRDVLAYMTRNAAQSLGLGDKIGTLEPGKYADVIVVDLSSPDTFLRTPETALIQAVNPGAITDVFVGGRGVKRDGKLTVITPADWDNLRKLATAARERLGTAS